MLRRCKIVTLSNSFTFVQDKKRSYMMGGSFCLLIMIIGLSSSVCRFKSEVEGSLALGRRKLEAGGIHPLVSWEVS